MVYKVGCGKCGAAHIGETTQRFTDKGLRGLKRISGVVVMGFGLYALGHVAWFAVHRAFW